MKISESLRVLVGSIFVSSSVLVACGGGTPAPSTSHDASGVAPQNAVFEVSISESMAAGPSAPDAEPKAYPERYRIEGAGSGKFVVVEMMSDNTRSRTAPVAQADVARLVSLAEKYKSVLHCIAGVGRAPYITRSIKVSGPVTIDVQTDCQGVSAPSEPPPAEYKQFKEGCAAMTDALLNVSQAALSTK